MPRVTKDSVVVGGGVGQQNISHGIKNKFYMIWKIRLNIIKEGACFSTKTSKTNKSELRI